MQIPRGTDCQSVLQSLGRGYVSNCRSPKARRVNAGRDVERVGNTDSKPRSGEIVKPGVLTPGMMSSVWATPILYPGGVRS